MTRAKTQKSQLRKQLAKAPTGIQGLDEIIFGELTQGRRRLVCGSAGCGKTLLAMEFLVRGATQFIKKICEENLQGHYDLDVIDLYQQPQLAQANRLSLCQR
jgi:predicted ATP-dependent serine protease